MVLIVDNQGLVSEVILGVVGDGVVEDVCNLRAKSKLALSAPPLSTGTVVLISRGDCSLFQQHSHTGLWLGVL